MAFMWPRFSSTAYSVPSLCPPAYTFSPLADPQMPCSLPLEEAFLDQVVKYAVYQTPP